MYWELNRVEFVITKQCTGRCKHCSVGDVDYVAILWINYPNSREDVHNNSIKEMGIPKDIRGGLTMELRKASKEDISALVEMRILYLTEDYGSISEEDRTSIIEQLPDYFERNLNLTVQAYLAEQDGLIVSTVLMVIVEKPANPHFITGLTGTLLNVYTRPEYRRQGIARRLVELALNEARMMNLSYVDLHATREGYPLYKAMGFQEQESDNVPMKYSFC